MPRRYTIILVSAVLLTATLTALAFLVRSALTFDPFAEVTICNASGQVIVEAVFTQADQTISQRNIQPGERRPLRFNRHPSGLDTSYLLSVRFADGRVLPDCGGSIGTGEKDDQIIRADGAETAHVRSSF